MNKIKLRVYSLLEPGEEGDLASKVVDLGLILLILVNVLVSILETVPEYTWLSSPPLLWFEAISIGVFTLEYFLRVWSCTSEGLSPIIGRLRFLMRPMLLIDLLAILPFFLQFLGLDFRMARIVRIVRFIRIAKLGRYSKALRLLGRSFWARKEELFITLLIGFFALVLSSSLIYYAEHIAQPDTFPSIPSAFWWAVTTLTTVGYGDAYPITLMGKIFGGISQVVGVGLFALPTGLLASAFLEQIEERKNETKIKNCPHCGKSLKNKD